MLHQASQVGSEVSLLPYATSQPPGRLCSSAWVVIGSCCCCGMSRPGTLCITDSSLSHPCRHCRHCCLYWCCVYGLVVDVRCIMACNPPV